VEIEKQTQANPGRCTWMACIETRRSLEWPSSKW